ncbi:MAG: response regulator transcription factor [Nitrospirae bacterium]|nr:response regulator transcription factor [Nitrospirota bacterium]
MVSLRVKQTILVVDDENDILTLLKYNLEKAGFNVLSSQDGPEAVSTAAKKRPDLIILDIMLPSMEGTEVCGVLKNRETTRDIPIIMLTAKGDEIDRIVGFELGADDYIIKPFSPRELVLRVKAVLKRGQEKEIKVIKAGPVSIDIGKSTASVDGRILSLTATEYKLLVELARSPGRVLTREVLLDRVWGEGCFVIDRTVDTHMTRLREKLGDYGSFIETVRGFGYRFRE